MHPFAAFPTTTKDPGLTNGDDGIESEGKQVNHLQG
jgi:hypothetical protein